jgi:hypothetical protein
VQAWLKRHPRFHMHFTPSSASWLNQVERFFGLITEDRIRCGVFKSVAELEMAIQQYSISTMPIPSPSSGPLPLPLSLRRWRVGDKR